MKLSFITFVVVLAGMILLTACGSGSPEASLSDIHLARDPEGTDATSVFSATDTFYVVANIGSAPKGTTVRAVWSGINASGGAEVITEGSRTMEENNFSGPTFFELVTDDIWPLGEYQVELFLNDALVETIRFTVE